MNQHINGIELPNLYFVDKKTKNLHIIFLDICEPELRKKSKVGVKAESWIFLKTISLNDTPERQSALLSGKSNHHGNIRYKYIVCACMGVCV